ncbi:uncharacterized protein LOC124912597 [Impatiens glandulifera]|uniref:uncharacterized protein LOC124912597 n=1 Tax=Impatiens glandulifera TaxID=253017 RepID=UPI001FB137E2|nr:uncharacterized protein LOC124912597 [Impatiens glandulifera]
MAFTEKNLSTKIILRKSIFTFLQHYPFFSTFSSFIAFPVAAAVLLSPAILLNSPLQLLVLRRLSLLFQAAAFPPSSVVFTFLNLKLSQVITSSFILIPLSISFNAICKTSVIHVISQNHSRRKVSLSYFRSIYSSIVETQLWVFFIILTANSVCYFIFFFAFNFMGSTILVSVLGCVIYSVVLANVVVICNLAIALSGMEKIGGYVSILKACVLIRGKMGIGLSIALPLMVAMAGFEALFQYRVMRVYYGGNDEMISMICMVFEGVLITYLYSIVLVLDFLVTCLFFKRCSDSCFVDDRIEDEIEEEISSGYLNLYYV